MQTRMWEVSLEKLEAVTNNIMDQTIKPELAQKFMQHFSAQQ